MQDLDRMTVERPHLMELKKHFIEHPAPIIDVANKNHRIKDASDYFKEINMNATIARLQDFKYVARSSQWFYKLIEVMLEKNIDKKPLTMFMTGKKQVVHCV